MAHDVTSCCETMLVAHELVPPLDPPEPELELDPEPPPLDPELPGVSNSPGSASEPGQATTDSGSTKAAAQPAHRCNRLRPTRLSPGSFMPYIVALLPRMAHAKRQFAARGPDESLTGPPVFAAGSASLQICDGDACYRYGPAALL